MDINVGEKLGLLEAQTERSPLRQGLGSAIGMAGRRGSEGI
jgi:hypothetical protein